MAPHSSTLAWKIPWMEEPGGLQSMGSLRVRHDWATSLLLFTFMHWRRKWQPTRVLAWRISGTGEPGGLLSMGSHRVGHNWSNLAAAAAERLNHHTQTARIRLSSKMWFLIHLALCPRSAYYTTTMRRINVQKWLNLMYAKYVYCYSLLSCVPFLIKPHEGKLSFNTCTQACNDHTQRR